MNPKPSFEQTLMSLRLPTKAKRSLSLWFLRRFLKGFYRIWAWRPSWSCDPDAPNKLSFPRSMEAPHEIWLRLAQRFWRRRSLKMVDGWTTTDDGACLYYKLTNEPKGSGELLTENQFALHYLPFHRCNAKLTADSKAKWFISHGLTD